MRLLVAALALGACVQAGGVPEPAGHGEPIPNEEPPCNAGPPQRLLGHAWSEELAGEAQRLAGARAVRPLRPGQVVTMEYRVDRLNLHLDARYWDTPIDCG